MFTLVVLVADTRSAKKRHSQLVLRQTPVRVIQTPNPEEQETPLSVCSQEDDLIHIPNDVAHRYTHAPAERARERKALCHLSTQGGGGVQPDREPSVNGHIIYYNSEIILLFGNVGK